MSWGSKTVDTLSLSPSLAEAGIGLSIVGTAWLGLFESAWAELQKAAGPSFNEEEAKKFMTRALELARKGMESGAGVPFAAVLSSKTARS